MMITIRIALLVAALLVPTLASAQSMSLPTRTFAPGSAISVTVSGNTSAYGMVGLYRPGDHDLNHLQWKYMNNSQAFPGAVIPSNVLTFTAPAALGNYEFRIFAPTAGQILSFTVGTPSSTPNEPGGTNPPPPPAPTGRIAFNGDSITAPYNITGSSNWATKVAAGLGFTQMVNLAANGKYASTVVAEASQMAGAAVCVVMIGTNDMSGSFNSYVPATQARDIYLGTMRQIVVAHKAVCGSVVIVTPPMPFHALHVTRYETIVPLLRQLCAEQGVAFLDLFHHMADLAASEGPAAYAWWNNPFDDPNHLSVAGHAMVAAFVLQSVPRP